MQIRFNPNLEEKKLKNLLKEAIEKNNAVMKEEVRGKLVFLYVQYGEYFKMNEVPDPKLAKLYLKKALQLQKDHTVSNYRLAHLLYREGNYFDALNHFRQSIDGSVKESLNDTQLKLARMFMVNCGIYIAKESLEEINESDTMNGISIDDNLIKKYQDEILAESLDSLDKMFYQIKTAKEEKIVSENVFQRLMDDPFMDGVLLGRDEKHFFIKHHGTIESLEKTAFMIYYTILTSAKLLTNEEISNQIYLDWFGREVSEEVIRQTLSRQNRRIQYEYSI